MSNIVCKYNTYTRFVKIKVIRVKQKVKIIIGHVTSTISHCTPKNHALGWASSHLISTGEEGQWGRTSGKGWHISFKKSLQQNTLSLFWLKLVPYRTGACISEDMYLALSSKGSSKNLVLTSIMLLITSLGMPWFTNCMNPQITNYFDGLRC